MCGRAFVLNEETNQDHVPPQTCFDVADRNPPLKLKTHLSCNNENKLNDEKVGELIAAQRDKSLNPDETHLNVRVFENAATGRRHAVFDNLNVNGAIRRWVGGFHAALYQRPLPPATPFAVSTPLPRAKVSGTKLVVDPVLPQHMVFVEALKLNRAAKNVDLIVTNAAKLHYECVWVPEDNGPRWLCVFALNVYGWIEIGDTQNFTPRGCVGFYLFDQSEVPPNATSGTRIQARVQNRKPLDPFGQ